MKKEDLELEFFKTKQQIEQTQATLKNLENKLQQLIGKYELLEELNVNKSTKSIT